MKVGSICLSSCLVCRHIHHDPIVVGSKIIQFFDQDGDNPQTTLEKYVFKTRPASTHTLIGNNFSCRRVKILGTKNSDMEIVGSASIYNSCIHKTKLCFVNIKDCEIEKSNIVSCEIIKSKINMATIKGCFVQDATINNVDITGARVYDSVIHGNGSIIWKSKSMLMITAKEMFVDWVTPMSEKNIGELVKNNMRILPGLIEVL